MCLTNRIIVFIAAEERYDVIDKEKKFMNAYGMNVTPPGSFAW